MTITVSKTFDTEAEAVAWLNGGAPAAGKTDAADKSSTKSTSAAKTSKPKVTKDDIETILNKVKDDLGVAAAKGLISEVGGVKKMDDIPEAKYAAVLKAAQEKLDEAGNADDDADDGGI